MPVRQMPGKLYGPNTASTPCGRWRSVAAPSGISVCCSPVRVWYAFTDIAILLIIAVTSVVASQRGLLVSQAMMRVSSALLASSSAANFQPAPALGEWPFRPRRKRAACSLTGLLNLPGACVVPRPEHLPPTGLVFVRASPSPVTQSPLIHRVMLFSPQGRAAPANRVASVTFQGIQLRSRQYQTLA